MYLTVCTFSLKIKESRLSDTICCITTLRYSLPNYFVMMSYHWNSRKTHQPKQRGCLMFIHSYIVSRIHVHILISNDIVWIFRHLYGQHFFNRSVDERVQWHWKWLNGNVMNERQQITWCHVQNIVFRVHVLYILFICLKL